MAYDFSKAATADIEKIIAATETTLSKNPNAANVAELRAYIADGRAELRKRNLPKYLMFGAVAGLLLFGKKLFRGK